MSWLHCMWGVGATLGPYTMGFALTHGYGWNAGYQWIGLLQLILVIILVFSLPLWVKKENITESALKVNSDDKNILTLKAIVHIPGAKEVMLCFFCYCALEQTAGLWASSYLTLYKGISPEIAAGFASLFFIGITVGRAISGFATMKFNDTQMVRIGQILIFAGVIAMLVPGTQMFSLAGLILIGLGCAPIYPCIIHSTPTHFGAERSQAIIGVQMASAYIGTCLMPPLFGVLAKKISVALLPLFLLVVLALMIVMHELLSRKTKSE